MRPIILFSAMLVIAQCSQAQMMGDLPHPVIMFASFSKQVAICEAAQPVFRGETEKYLREVDRIAPGYLDSSQLGKVALELVRTASKNDLSDVTEAACQEKVFAVAEKALAALPCYATRSWKECPVIGE
jgi:hypothetical protein